MYNCIYFLVKYMFHIRECMLEKFESSYKLSNGSNGYKGNVFNVEQDLTSLVKGTELWRIEDLPVVIVKMTGQHLSGGYRDFRVRRDRV